MSDVVRKQPGLRGAVREISACEPREIGTWRGLRRARSPPPGQVAKKTAPLQCKNGRERRVSPAGRGIERAPAVASATVKVSRLFERVAALTLTLSPRAARGAIQLAPSQRFGLRAPRPRTWRGWLRRSGGVHRFEGGEDRRDDLLCLLHDLKPDFEAGSDEGFVAHVREQVEEGRPEVGDVGEDDRLGVTAELRPCQLFDQFFQRADAAGRATKAASDRTSAACARACRA